MQSHPAKLMLGVWVACIAAFVLLPYQLVERALSVEGMVVFVAFLLAFLAGTQLVRAPRARDDRRWPAVDASRAERLLAIASVVAAVCFLLDLRDKNVFDLALAYELRSETADALLNSEASNSSGWFQVAFVLYPAAYVYGVVHVLYARRLVLWRFALFGFAPVVLATLAMGGRVPIFYGMVAAGLAYRERSRMLRREPGQLQRAPRAQRLAIGVAAALVFAGMAYYFSAVFFVRAQVAGGAAEMFDLAETRWGIGFSGPLSGPIFALLGDELTYLLFVFIWYPVQGLVMSNYIFGLYDGPLQFGVYGLDLMAALMRRLDPTRVAEGFNSLMTLGTYGFLPSAFGSLFVDLWYFGLLVAAAWGAVATFVYRRIRFEHDTRWMVAGPFVTMGIVFSLINTPLGFTNGLVTHVWLVVAFACLRRRGAAHPAPVAGGGPVADAGGEPAADAGAEPVADAAPTCAP